MKIELDIGTVIIDIPSPKLGYLTDAFFEIQKLILKHFFQNVILIFAEYYMTLVKKPFTCDKM